MSLNGSGVYNVNSTGQPVVATTLIEAATFNAFTADMATALSTCIMKDGQQTVTADIPFGANKLTGVGAPTARTDAATLAAIQDGTGVYSATVGGTADVITLTPSPAITAYAAGQTFYWIASGVNTTNVTVDINGVGAKALTKNGAIALVAADIPSGMLIGAIYDGTQFQLIAKGAVTGKGADIASASPFVVGTDGDYFIGTGTTGFSTFTVAVNRHFFIEFSGILTMTHGAGTLDLPGQANITTAAGDVGEFFSTAADVVTCVNYTKAVWTDEQIGGNVLAAHEGLVCKYVTTTTSDIDIDAVKLTDSSGNTYRAESVNLTVNITNSGANGLDTGSEASDTWYYQYVIYDGSTVAGLLSVSATSPTMPSGYTYKALVSAVYNDASSSFDNFYQVGNYVNTILTTVVNTGSLDTPTSVDLSATIPVNAKKVFGYFSVDEAASTGAARLQLWSNSGGTRGLQEVARASTSGAGSPVSAPFRVIVETAQTLWYQVTSTADDGDVHISGWEY